jgi:hypothetical protein
VPPQLHLTLVAESSHLAELIEPIKTVARQIVDPEMQPESQELGYK